MKLSETQLRQLAEKLYAAGFAASAEGWNGEVFGGRNYTPANDEHWQHKKNEDLTRLLAEVRAADGRE